MTSTISDTQSDSSPTNDDVKHLIGRIMGMVSSPIRRASAHDILAFAKSGEKPVDYASPFLTEVYRVVMREQNKIGFKMPFDEKERSERIQYLFEAFEEECRKIEQKRQALELEASKVVDSDVVSTDTKSTSSQPPAAEHA